MLQHLVRAALALALAAALMVSDSGVASAVHTQGGDLLPDLLTMPPRDLTIELAGSQKRLRFRNEVANAHNGPLEIFPESADSGDCNGDGSSSNDRVVYQRIFRDVDFNGYFTRGSDTRSRVAPAGCMVFHTAHNHWHFDAFARYELRDLSGGSVRLGAKQSFCIEDFGRPFSGLAGSPGTDYYVDCNQAAPQGISVGWSDVYRNFLPGQYVVITGVPNGDYCLVSSADPQGVLAESNEGNNSNSVRLRLNNNSVTALSGGCTGSPPPPSTGSAYVYADTLRWENWSWNTTVNNGDTSPVYAGSRSLSFGYTAAWAGLAFHHNGFNTSGFNRLRFAFNPNGGTLPPIDVYLYNSAGQALTRVRLAPYATAVGGGWYEVSIPLSDLQGASRTITRVVLREDGGSAKPTYNIDELRFTS